LFGTGIEFDGLDLNFYLTALADSSAHPRNAQDKYRILTQLTDSGVGRTDVRVREPLGFAKLEVDINSNITTHSDKVEATQTATLNTSNTDNEKPGYWGLKVEPALAFKAGTTPQPPETTATWIDAVLNENAANPQSANLGWLKFPKSGVTYQPFQEPFAWFFDQAADGYVAAWDRAKFSEFDINSSAHMLSHADTVLYRFLPNGKPNPISLAPFIPRLALADRRAPGKLLYDLDFQHSSINIKLEKLNDDGTTPELVFDKQSLVPTGIRLNHPRNKFAESLSAGGVHITDVPQLVFGATDNVLYHRFTESGRYRLTTTGILSSINGPNQALNQTIEFIVADRGITPLLSQLPMMPILIGTEPMLSLHTIPPRPVDINLTWKHSASAEQTITGKANMYGFWKNPTALSQAQTEGEYRLDLSLFYRDADGVLYASSRSMASVITEPESPAASTKVRGQRFFDNVCEKEGLTQKDCTNRDQSRRHNLTWFKQGNVSVSGDPAPYIVSDGHAYNTFHGGDILWIQEDHAAIMTASIEQLPSEFDAATIDCGIHKEKDENGNEIGESARFFDTQKPEIPMMTCWNPSPTLISTVEKNYDQTNGGFRTYAYTGSERYHIRVREAIGDRHAPGYWRFDDSYGAQRGVGASGDHPDELKAQFVGLVVEKFDGSKSYAASASAFVLTGDENTNAELNDSRVQPPFTDDALLVFNGQDKDAVLWPSSIIPGDIIEQGSQLAYTGQMLPPTDVSLNIQVTAPDQTVLSSLIKANRIGYLRSQDPITFNQPGVWKIKPTVDVSQATRSDGAPDAANIKANINPNPLLSVHDDYYVFVVPAGTAKLPLKLSNPAAWGNSAKPGPWLAIDSEDNPAFHLIADQSKMPGANITALHHVAFMDGWILQQGSSATPSVEINLHELKKTFRTLDAAGSNYTDLIRITLLAEGTDKDGQPTYWFRNITLHGQEMLLD
ncbi:MAG: hypothetical protein WAO12_10980, partial [Venatoribacter sp.]